MGRWFRSRGWWMRPTLHRSFDGGNLLLGPVQVNWYNRGLRVHVTWPTQKTFTLRQTL